MPTGLSLTRQNMMFKQRCARLHGWRHRYGNQEHLWATLAQKGLSLEGNFCHHCRRAAKLCIHQLCCIHRLCCICRGTQAGGAQSGEYA